MKRFSVAEIKALFAFGILGALVLLIGQEAQANIPNWTRKYNIPCSSCHTTFPQLNRTGIEFRRLGFRFPSEVQKPEGKAAAPKPAADPQMAAHAGELLDKAGCRTCHAVGGKGEGTSLNGIGAKRDAGQILEFVKGPDHPGGTPENLTADELRAIADYLSTLQEAEAGEGKKYASYNMSDFISSRARSRLQDVNPSNAKADFEFRFNDMTFYFAGPVNRTLTTFLETEFEEGFDPNVLAQVSVRFGGADRYFYVRAGNMRTVRQGVGPLDRPKTISTDLVVSTRAHSIRFNEDQRGVELAYGFNKNRTLLRGMVTNGVTQAGAGRPVGQQDTNNEKDFVFIGEQLFGTKTATALSAVYYRGRRPDAPGKDVDFDRLGLFGTLAFNNKQNIEDIRINGGVMVGYDDVPGQSGNDRNLGLLAGVDKLLAERLYLSLRYDQFDPTDRIDDNTTRAYTGALIKEVLDWLRLTAEYQHFRRPGEIKENRIVGELFVHF